MIHKYEAGSLPTKPANRLEMDTFYRLAASAHTLKSFHEDLKVRAQMIPGGWRDLRACVALMEKTVRSMMPTFDEKKRAQIARQMRNMRFRVVFGPEASREPESVIVTVDDLAVLLCAAGEECRLRMCKPDECNHCQLGQVIDRCSFVTRDNRAWWEVIEAARKENDDEQL